MTDIAQNLNSKISLFASDIKIAHTVFALPFALLSTFIAAGGSPRIPQLLFILLCMFTARTFAMSANRLLDANLDARNPRTANRAIPSGKLSRAFYLSILIACGLAFILATGAFQFLYHNPWPLYLCLPVLIFLAIYPYTKRFTRLCHYHLGAALALAPLCAWLAIKGQLDLPPLLIAAAVLTWTAGFDIIYATQDYDSDLKTATISIPAILGIPRALWISRLTHAASAAFLILLGFSTPLLSTLYFIAVACAIILLIIEHSLVPPTDLSKANLAFFTMNSLLSILLATLGIIDVFF